MEFSHPYYYNRQRMVIREGTPYSTIPDLAGQRISVVAGSRGEAALAQWMARQGVNFEIVRHLSQDGALDALANSEVEGMVGEEDDLIRAGRLQMSFVGEYISQDPYAIAFRRHDVNLRNAVNRSLQRLYASGRLAEVAENWFPDESINFAAFIPVYQSLYEDDRSIEDFPPDIPMPDRSIIEKIASGETVRVAGLSLNDSAPGYQRYLDVFNRELMLEMGRRWGVNIDFVPDTYGLAADAVSQNMADVGVGVAPRWDGADRVNYSVPYHYRSDRIIVLEGSRYGSINDFRTGSWIGYYEDTPADFERLEEIKEALNLTFDIYRFPNNSRVTEMFSSRDIDALFADNIRLQYLIENSNLPFKFYERNWSFEPIVVAAPRNDADFLTLVNWTLGEMYADGTITRIWQEHYASYIDTQFGGNTVNDWIPNWPGDGQFLYDNWFSE
jgi:ABC-type amino acid transport substrate-binding protein